MLLNCPCGATHNPYVRWTFVRYDGTSSYSTEVGPRLPLGSCPICRRLPVRIERQEPSICRSAM
jgi:hypothetical protein